MKGIRLIFGENGVTYDFTTPVEGFEATVQNALVNLGTQVGTDRMFPDRGTDLLKTGLSGAIVDLNTAGHASSLAALDTLFFSRTWEQAGVEEKLARIQLRPLSLQDRSLLLEGIFVSTAGKQIGVSSLLT